ncbi:MAG TPA: (d)CMP kinase [Ignavibacteriaceae bacterium]|nr:(d)CMP kinase [Ignavibacteriaceae bacterium]
MSKKLIVAIDGPAGSGKSTSAKLVAQRLGFVYIDTGAMYRAVTFLAMRNNLLDNEKALIEIANSTDIQLDFVNGVTRVLVDGEDITGEIRTLEVNRNVSGVSKIEDVRKALVAKQQKMGKQDRGVVMEGRDITTVVFPEADVKIFLTASIDQRAMRRAEEYEMKGKHVAIDEIKKNLQQRDKIDSTRKVSPLLKAEDAVEIDTSMVSIEQQVEMILEQVKIAGDKKGIEVNI